MIRHEFDGPSIDNYRDIEEVAGTMFSTYGVRGVTLTVETGRKTWCGAEKNGGIRINIDPDELGGEQTLTPEAVKAAAAHEMGHALFMLEDPDSTSKKLSSTDHFFNNLTEDVVIDSRLRRFPALEQPMADLYQQVMGGMINDLTATPLSNQLMYGIRISQVLGLQPAVDERVSQMIDSLRSHDSNGQTFDIIDTMAQPNTSLAQMRQIAERFIKPLYDQLLEQDRQDGRNDEVQQAIDNYEQSHGAHGSSEQNEEDDGSSASAEADQSEDGDGEKSDGDKNPTKSDSGEGGGDDDAADHPKSLPEQIKEAIEQAAENAEENGEDSGPKNDSGENNYQKSSGDKADETDHPTAEELAQAAGSLAKEMNLSLSDAEGYLRMALEHQQTILGVAEVFKQLARPTASTQRMTNVRGRSQGGVTIHTDAISDLAAQETSRLPAKAIWQKTDRRATRQTLDFGGLDIHLLVDVSVSMQGNSAHCATATAVCLLEGLNLAKSQIARENSYQMPDVRTHVVAFGSSAVELSPLNHQTDPINLGRTYHALMNPDSWSTLVSGAIRMSQTPPQRDGITLIISDGQFADTDAAKTIVNQQPENHYVGQFVIGGNGSPITEHYHELSNPHMLPNALLSVLQNYLRRYS
ncbi:MAG: hypothetical protein Q4A37_02150 [Candidatus Saccharibacteria bacterium]|nr:hypothetical protein [Candidatus Saccharibacteria bacterium]